MAQITSLLANWQTREPAASLWLAVVAVLLFGVTVVRTRDDAESGWAWGRRLIEALVKALVFVGLLGAVYFLLSSNYAAFGKIYGSFTTGSSLSNQNWQQWRNRYGGGYLQRDLQATQYTSTETQEVISATTPSRLKLYRTVKVEQPVQQNSLIGFRGHVTVTVADPGPQNSAFNGYALAAVYEYDIVNPEATNTRTEFKFPLSADAKLYQALSVRVNGENISAWHIISDSIVWGGQLKPGEKNTVAIQYSSRGMDSFFFEIPEPREVISFSLTVALDTDRYGTRTEPENSGIHLAATTALPYRLATWSIDRSIMSPILGIYLPQQWPYAPYQEMITTLIYAARASVLFLCLATLTLLICRVPVSLRQLALLAGLFAIPYLMLMAGGLPVSDFVTPAQLAGWQVNMLPVLSIVPLVLAFITLRKLPRLPAVLTLVLMALFMSGYAFVGLLPDEQKRNATESLVQAGMIAYILGLTLFTRVRSAITSESP